MRQLPSESLRKKLVLAGIPESQHSMEALSDYMPVDFKTESQPISIDMLAELVLYFIAKGLISVPVAGDKALLDMPWGAHVCQFFETKYDLITMLVPYFKQGLEKNEACIWLIDNLTAEEAKKALAAAVPNLDQYLTSGQMKIVHYTDFYTNPDGTVKASDTLRDQFASLGTSVVEQGYEGLRASGSVSWVDTEDGMSRFMEYETKVNSVIQGSRMRAVCTYPLKAAGLHSCRELIHNHGKFFVKRGEWVHDKSKDAEKIEAVFTSLARAQSR